MKSGSEKLAVYNRGQYPKNTSERAFLFVKLRCKTLRIY